MTFERKIVVGLEDIASISLECNKCKGRVTFGPESKIRIPLSCSCGHPWMAESKSPFTSLDSPFAICLTTIEVIRTLIRNGAGGFRVLLEFQEPHEC